MTVHRVRVLLDEMVAHRWLVLSAVAVVAAGLHLMVSAWFSWHFIVAGSQDLYSPAGLHLYARHPELQMGPLTFLLGGVFAVALPAVVGQWAALGFMVAAGLFALRDGWYLADIRSAGQARLWMLAACGATLVWSEVAVHYGHLDDVMALVLMVRAIRLARDGRAVSAALFVGLAIDFKPWAVPVAAVLLAAPGRLRAAGLLLGGVLLAVWVPFFLADPASIGIVHFRIPVSSDSSLKVFGVANAFTPPWDRAAQLGGGLLIAGVAVLRRRWSAVLLLIVALRMLLDPATYPYYDSGLVLGAAILDGSGRLRVPVATAVAVLTVDLPAYAFPPSIAAPVRTAGLLILIALALHRVIRRTATHQTVPVRRHEAPGAVRPSPRSRPAEPGTPQAPGSRRKDQRRRSAASRRLLRSGWGRPDHGSWWSLSGSRTVKTVP